MAKIPVEKVIALFEEIIGWPYRTPGSNDRRGIDCSGAWVRVYQTFGLKIDHGSNSQYRRYCIQTGTIGGLQDLRTGMAVFKVREWKASQAAHRDYGKIPGDLYHVGCVTCVNPLRIIHATSPYAKADTTLGQWKMRGMLKDVAYETTDGERERTPNHQSIPSDPLFPQTPFPSGIEPAPGWAKVITKQDNLNLRWEPNTNRKPKNSMPPGTVVKVIRRQGNWAQVLYTDARGMPHSGWCSTGEDGTDYLEFG